MRPVLRKVDIDPRPWMETLTRIFRSYWQTYVDPNTGIVYNTPYDPECLGRADHPVAAFVHTDPSAFAFPTDYARPDLGSWPTPEEVAASVPGTNGWCTSIEDASRRGPDLLTGIARGAFDLAPEERREKAAHLFKGLASLWDAPGRGGFVCRGFLPASRAFYKQTTHDQVPHYLAGLAAYHDSSFSTAAQKKQIVAILDSVMRWLEGNSWNLKHSDGAEQVPPQVLTPEHPHVYIKFLGILALAHRVTGDPHWHDAYVRMRDSDERRWSIDFVERIRTEFAGAVVAVCQFLRLLSDCESDAAWRARYDELRWSMADVLAESSSGLSSDGDTPTAGSLDIQTHVRPDWRPFLLQEIQRSGFAPGERNFHSRYRQTWREAMRRQRLSVDDARMEPGLRLLTDLRAYRLIAADWPADRGAEQMLRLRSRLVEALAVLS